MSLSRLLPSPTTRSASQRPIQMPFPYLLDNHSLLLDLFFFIHPDSPILVLHERTPYPIKSLTPALSSPTHTAIPLASNQRNTIPWSCDVWPSSLPFSHSFWNYPNLANLIPSTSITSLSAKCLLPMPPSADSAVQSILSLAASWSLNHNL